jgi:hypothetical protein
MIHFKNSPNLCQAQFWVLLGALGRLGAFMGFWAFPVPGPIGVPRGLFLPQGNEIQLSPTSLIGIPVRIKSIPMAGSTNF